eukprot:TRINITY_DN11086_c0_g1_i1.p1 TRINITY_DN11086_c0_g1~~TRINITY_DN11086_c0_g1_i1.p1  ORF type:complete len:93 (-),score=15.68 TRINITY_DN11086_c0_g1_i1:106-384(-)
MSAKTFTLFCIISFFLCLFSSAIAQDPCLSITDAKTCITTLVNGTACEWCVSKAVPSGCFDSEDAHRLPPATFVCSNSSTSGSFTVSVDITN